MCVHVCMCYMHACVCVWRGGVHVCVCGGGGCMCVCVEGGGCMCACVIIRVSSMVGNGYEHMTL